VKENQPELLAAVERLTAQGSPRLTAGPRSEGQAWDLAEVDWPVAGRMIRVVKTVERTQQPQRVIVPEGERRRSRIMLMEHIHTNVFATDLPPRLVPTGAGSGVEPEPVAH
jgi:hypothetical protein